MAECIDREAAFNAITDLAGKAPTRSAYEAVWKSARVLKKIPAADVAPVVHGHRVDTGRFYTRCSQCDGVLPLYVNYCPNCGAKMDEGEDHGKEEI